MTGVADRRRAFAWLDLEALERIDAHAPESVAAGVHNVYLALARMAARRFDGEHDGFEATRSELAGLARTSTRTIDRHVAELERLGLVAVERRLGASGSPLPSRYVLVDPPAETQRLDVARVATSSRHPGDTAAAAVSPHRARHDAVKEKEEGERERDRAQEGISGEIGGGSETEQAVAAELAALLADRGEQLTARDRLAIRSAVHATPAGVDPVAAAARIRANYGSDGRAANRRIGNVVAILIAEIEQSTAGPAAKRGQRSRPTGRAPQSAPETAEARAARLTSELRIHQARPETLDPPTRRLRAAWDLVREALHARGGTWAYIHSVDLAGTMATLLADADGEDTQVVIVLDAQPDQLEAIARNGKRITRLFEQALEDDSVIVEVAPDAQSSPAVAA